MKAKLTENGFAIKENLYTRKEVTEIIERIQSTKEGQEQFAIRQFFEKVPASRQLIFTQSFISFFTQHIGANYFLIKAIYFDKPPNANWIVPWHQDLTIVTDRRIELEGFSKWRLKNQKHYVQPTKEILENIVTIRIHLDDCNRSNGALKVISGSHRNGINQKLDFDKEKSVICEVKCGGILLMKPLLYHASKRTENNKNRRVLHLEFASKALPNGINYEERIDFM